MVTNHEDASDAALRSVKTWAGVCFVGLGNEATFDIANDVIKKQLTLFGSWTFNVAGQRDCARFVAERDLPVEKLFTHSFTLDQAEEAYKLFDAGKTGKCVMLPN